ncbi:MAG: Mammalian cell entry related domain protein [Solirubrobacterales bacterium]|nr:Mammalian cell entry related domain protein [Solirubrobacterales bacterium]
MTVRTKQRRDATRRYPLLGVAAILAVAGVVYISYTAPNGLPLESAYRITVDVPNANRLAKHAQVRIGGVRVGQVAGIEGVAATQSRRSYAKVRLRLNRSVDPLPVDSRVLVRPVSVLGSTYVELMPGRRRTTVADGGSLALDRASTRADLNDLLDVFDKATALRVQNTLGVLGNGVAGQGGALNASLASMSAVMPRLSEVSRTLVAPDTRLPELIRAYARFAGELEPVADDFSALLAHASGTSGALARERTALGTSIGLLPPTERAVTSGITRLRGPLDELGALAKALRPGVRRLPQSLSNAVGVMDDGLPPLRRVPAFSAKLHPALGALDAFSRRASTSGVLRKVADLMRASQPLFRQLAESEQQCHGLALMFRNLGPTGGGMGTGDGPGLTTLVLSTLGADNEMTQRATVAGNLGMNYIPNNTRNECESGNEPYTNRQSLSNPPGLQRNQTRETKPPQGVPGLARQARLWDLPEGAR